MRDDENDMWFVAGPTGPVTWHYWRRWWCAAVELLMIMIVGDEP